MRHYFIAAIWAAGLLLSSPLRAEPPTAEIFGNLPEAEMGRISPDGKHLAVVKPYKGYEKVAIIDLTKPDAPPYMVGVQDGLAGNVFWKTNTLLICTFHANFKQKGSKDINAWNRAISADITTQTTTLLMHDAPFLRFNFNTGLIVDRAADDPNHIYIPEQDRWDHIYTLDLYRVDVKTGHAELAMHGNWRTIRFLSDGNGHLVGRIDQDELTNHVFVKDNEVYSYPVKGNLDFEIVGLTPGDNPQFVVEKPTPAGTAGLYSWMPPRGFGDALFSNPAYDIDDVITDEHTGRVIGATYSEDSPRAKYFDPAIQRIQDSLEKAYPGQSVSILSKDDAGATYVILTQGPKNPPVLSLFTTANHQVNIVQEAYSSLKSADLGDVKPYPYKARDGLDIHAYLTLPPGKPPHNLPAVIFPHGGPEARDSIEFDWWAQFMASRGYAVFQPNFRGSAGYGWNFIKAGDGEWAGKVQDDVQDGVKKLIADGIVDPKRVCIVGASYGGYMALAGATFSPDLYACAVSFAGPSDIGRLLYTGTSFDSESSLTWKRRVGADVDRGKMDSQSPINFVERVNKPVLLIHSEKDVTVPIVQSQIENDALKRAHKDVEFVTLQGDDHYLEFGETRIKLLKEIERFLAKNIGN